MAVRVRCPTCEKVLNAPDAARGKAIKCPGCDTKVKVPVGETPAGEGKSTARKSGTPAPAKKVASPDSSEFLARLDLDDVAHSDHAICPKCGASIPEEASECPKCGVDPSTGQLSARSKKRRSMKGPDPSQFYREALTDSWAFVKENRRIVLRTFLYVILFLLLIEGCTFMIGWCTSLPPKFFYIGMDVLLFLVMPGWVWFLTIETIRTTVVKKRLSLGKVNFDIFECMALGIKLILWIIVFGCWFPFVGFMYPLAMIHMAMPVTKRAWINFLMFPTFIRNLAPTLYACLIMFVTYLPWLIALGVVGYVYGPALDEIRRTEGKPSFPMSQAWTAIGVTLFVGHSAWLIFSVAVLFNARVIGLFAYYFQNSLDLVTFVAEKTYVHKAPKLDRFGVPIKSKGQKVGEIFLVIGVFVVVGAAGYFVYKTVTK